MVNFLAGLFDFIRKVLSFDTPDQFQTIRQQIRLSLLRQAKVKTSETNASFELTASKSIFTGIIHIKWVYIFLFRGSSIFKASIKYCLAFPLKKPSKICLSLSHFPDSISNHTAEIWGWTASHDFGDESRKCDTLFAAKLNPNLGEILSPCMAKEIGP